MFNRTILVIVNFKLKFSFKSIKLRWIGLVIVRKELSMWSVIIFTMLIVVLKKG